MPKYRRILGITKQPPVRYGPNVQRFAADAAVRHFRPEVVIAAWVTHRYDPKRHHAGGNEIGVDEIDILAHCQHYILIGNTHVHRHKEIWRRPTRSSTRRSCSPARVTPSRTSWPSGEATPGNP